MLLRDTIRDIIDNPPVTIEALEALRNSPEKRAEVRTELVRRLRESDKEFSEREMDARYAQVWDSGGVLVNVGSSL